MGTTPEMNLPYPEPGVTPAPLWGQEQVTATQLISAHDHSPGKGVTVPTAGININDDLGCHGYALTNVKRVAFTPQLTESGNDSVYVKGVDLFYRDGNGSEIQLTLGGRPAGGGGGGGTSVAGLVPVGTIAGLRSVDVSKCDSTFLYMTNGYNASGDGGSAFYYWSPGETRPDDGCYCFNLTGNAGSGRMLNLAPGGILDLRASPLAIDRSGLTDYGATFQLIMQAAKSFGVSKLLLPPWRVPCATWVTGVITGEPKCAISDVELVQATGGSLCGAISRDRCLKGVDAATGVLPAFVATGSGATRTLTATVNGALTVDTVAMTLGKTFLYTAVSALAGIYVITQAGDASHPWVALRRGDFNSSAACVPRTGVIAVGGSANKYNQFVMSNHPGGFWTDTAMVMDTDVQYWGLEPFGTGIYFASLLDFPFFSSAAYGSLPPTSFAGWVNAGQFEMTGATGLGGGTWVNGPNVWPYAPTKVGDKLLCTIGGDPTDQGGIGSIYLARVDSINGTTVRLSRPNASKQKYIHSDGTPGNYTLTNNYPTYNLNVAAHNTDNNYRHVLAEAGRLKFTNVVFDGLTPSFAMCEDVFLDRCVFQNAHIGPQIYYCTLMFRIRDPKMLNMTSHSLAGNYDAYGWQVTAVGSEDVLIDGLTSLGCNADFCDFEGNADVRINSTNIVAILDEVTANGGARQNFAVLATTPNCTRTIRCVDFEIRGTMNSQTLLSSYVHNLTHDMRDAVSNQLGFSADTAQFTGALQFRARRFDCTSRRQWVCTIPIFPSTNRILWRPFSGLWCNTRIMKHFTLSSGAAGLVSFGPNDTISGVLFELAPFINSAPNDTWVNVPMDQLSIGYPNQFGNLSQFITWTSDATITSPSYLTIATDIIQETNRGDGYDGVSTLTTDFVPGLGPVATLMKVVPDQGVSPLIAGGGAPAVTPSFPGQQYMDMVAGALYWASDTSGIGDWKKLTP